MASILIKKIIKWISIFFADVPDTKKSYVTSLAINMARSVGPCVPPDPSVLLALNLGQVKDPTAQDILIEQLKNDAVDRVSKSK